MQERAVVPSPALLAGEDEGEGTEQLGRGGARDPNRRRANQRRLANRNPHLNPLPRVMRERAVHLAVGGPGVLQCRSPRPGPNQPLEATAGSCRALASSRLFTRRASAASRSARKRDVV